MRKKKKFVNYFIKKEKKFLYKIDPKLYRNKEFEFYIGWFIDAIQFYMITIDSNEKDGWNLEKTFTELFNEEDNDCCDKRFLIYIRTPDFKLKVVTNMVEYLIKYNESFPV